MNRSISTICKTVKLAIAIVFIASSASVGKSAQPPMLEKEIAEKSDVAVVADVLGVVCAAKDQAVTRYEAWVRIQKVLKQPEHGDLEPNGTLVVPCTKIGAMAGGINVEMLPGQHVKLYLNKDDRGYTVWHQDGKITLENRDGRQGLDNVARSSGLLPTKPGEVIVANGKGFASGGRRRFDRGE